MDMRELRYFIAVFEERNLTAAAKRCFVSQPSISVAIANLEQELGTVLFIRHKKGVAPTASADDLYPLARRLVGQAEALPQPFQRPGSPPQPDARPHANARYSKDAGAHKAPNGHAGPVLAARQRRRSLRCAPDLEGDASEQ